MEPVKISYDARGLAEPDAQAPRTATVERGADGARAVFDAAELTTRQINLELRRLVYDEGIERRDDPQPGREALARGGHPGPLQDHDSTAASATSAAG